MLTSYNSRTCDYLKFKEYVKAKSILNQKLFEEYEKEYFRKLRWFSYLNTKRSEDKLLNKIEKTYGKNPVIILGDGCRGNEKLKFISTPNISLKRKLKERFEVYLINEFRTSCLNHLTEKKQENLYLRFYKFYKFSRFSGFIGFLRLYKFSRLSGFIGFLRFYSFSYISLNLLNKIYFFMSVFVFLRIIYYLLYYHKRLYDLLYLL